MGTDRRDLAVQCCRCKHGHHESERVDVPHKTIKSATQSACPRCGAHSFYDMTPQMAYCWASGLIELGDQIPEGALPIAAGPASSLKSWVSVVARHGYGASAGQLLVPGVPEAERKDALKALQEWISWCRRTYRPRSFPGIDFDFHKEAA